MNVRFSILATWLFLGSHFAFSAALDDKTLLWNVRPTPQQLPSWRLNLESTDHTVLAYRVFSPLIKFGGEQRIFGLPRHDKDWPLFAGKEGLGSLVDRVSVYNPSGTASAPPSQDPIKLRITSGLSWDTSVKATSSYLFRSNVQTNRWIDVEDNFRALRDDDKWQTGSHSVNVGYENLREQQLPHRTHTEQFLSCGEIRSGTIRRLQNPGSGPPEPS